MDTQQILQSQERVHNTHTTSYHKLYNELSVSYQALRLSEEQLRQSHACLTEQLSEKEKQISDLQVQLQHLQQPQACEELRRAHAKRHDRLRLIQTNYRAVKEQLKEVEDTQDFGAVRCGVSSARRERHRHGLGRQ
ncbi:centlein isoform X1 [Silurus meridionalis]|nr:centlein isoform X1 [Silurus meridionalis]